MPARTPLHVHPTQRRSQTQEITFKGASAAHVLAHLPCARNACQDLLTTMHTPWTVVVRLADAAAVVDTVHVTEQRVGQRRQRTSTRLLTRHVKRMISPHILPYVGCLNCLPSFNRLSTSNGTSSYFNRESLVWGWKKSEAPPSLWYVW